MTDKDAAKEFSARKTKNLDRFMPVRYDTPTAGNDGSPYPAVDAAGHELYRFRQLILKAASLFLFPFSVFRQSVSCHTCLSVATLCHIPMVYHPEHPEQTKQLTKILKARHCIVQGQQIQIFVNKPLALIPLPGTVPWCENSLNGY